MATTLRTRTRTTTIDRTVTMVLSLLLVGLLFTGVVYGARVLAAEVSTVTDTLSTTTP